VDFRIPILTYHKIAPVDSKSIYPGTFVPPQLFGKHLRHLALKGYTTSRLESAFTSNSSQKTVVLTFDDGFQDFADEAFPRLNKVGFHSTVFLVANHIGGHNEWDTKIGDSRASLMSKATILQLHEQGVEFGSHTLSHAHLDQISAAEQRVEIINSRTVLESELGIPINTFCFPYGGYNEYTLKCVDEAGYCVATSTEKGINTAQTDQRRLKRIAIRNDTSLPVFIYKLWRAYRLGK
jgi:peptidoglycan/xylan/chitin deacetylase (PgdA/CDA1 family)